MKSMTGYGAGTSESAGTSVSVEISSVNRKQLDLRIVLPKELGTLERDVRAWLQGRISRGAVTVGVNCTLGEADRSAVQRLDRELAAEAADELRAIAEQAGIEARISLQDLLAVPGVVLEEQAKLPLDRIRPRLLEALEFAFAEFDSMRLQEGDALLSDIRARVAAMKEAAGRIRSEAAGLLDTYREKLRRRALEMGLDLAADDERLIKEAVFLADRSDITEEITRLDSHFDQLERLLNSNEPPGRSLEFLCQELHREINTIAAKSGGTTSAENVFVLKTELGRVKEQSMNLE